MEFQYEPLKGLNNFRLLKLEAGRATDPLKITLFPSSISDCLNRYAALSYTWGDPNSRVKISCDGFLFHITSNLHSALTKLRLPDLGLMLWVDAICINQNDLEERAIQVALMSQIYRGAYLVVVDLGEAGDEYNDVAEIFNALQDVVKTTAANEQIQPDDYPRYGLPPLEDKKWERWVEFLLRPWFGRVWVIQEYAFAKALNMSYGDTDLHGESILGMVTGICQRGFPPMTQYGNVGYPNRHAANYHLGAMTGMLSARRDVQAGRSRGLLCYLRYLSSFCDATDKRDMVYALLNLATESERSALKVSYSDSVANVYLRTTQLLIQQGQGIDVLYEAAGWENVDELPSWTPDWSRDRSLESLGWLFVRSSNVLGDKPRGGRWAPNEESRIFRAAGRTRGRVRVTGDGRLLQTRGIYADDIEAVTEPYNQGKDIPPFQRLESIHAFSLAGRVMIHNLKKLLRYFPGEGEFNALWRTLVADVANDEDGDLKRPASPDLADSFAALTKLFEATPDGTTKYIKQSYFERLLRESAPFVQACEQQIGKRRLCITRRGFIGLAPGWASKGDNICVVLGAAVPFVTRKSQNGNDMLIGECYVHGLMDGEALDMVLDEEDVFEQDIILE